MPCAVVSELPLSLAIAWKYGAAITPVICLVVEDAENTHIVYSLDGHTYTSTATPMRSFLLFGYLSDGDLGLAWNSG